MTKVAREPLSALAGELVSAAPPAGAIRGFLFSLRALAARRELLDQLVRRELKARYKGSTLGVLWSLARPLAMLAVYYVVIGKFLGAERSIPEFAIFVFTGLTAWGLYSEVISSATVSIVNNAALIKKVYVPREVFPLSAVGSAGVNFLAQFAILVVATVALGQAPVTENLWYLPLALAVLLVVSLGVGLLLSALNVYFRDVQHLLDVLLLLLFWASPIVYSYGMVHDSFGGGWLEQVYLANPFTPIVLGFQRAMWVAGAEQPWPPDLALRLAVLGLIGLVMLWIAQRVFARLEGKFAQNL